MRRAVALLFLFGTAACGSRAAYSFPGCEDAGRDCLGAGVWGCAQRHLAQRFDGCNTDADCVLLDHHLIGCGGSGQMALICTAAVRPELAGAYEDEVANEAQRMCELSSDQTICLIASEGCEVDAFFEVAACDVEAGRCIVERNPDAGSAPAI